MRPQRQAWADMVSDDSESDADRASSFATFGLGLPVGIPAVTGDSASNGSPSGANSSAEVTPCAAAGEAPIALASTLPSEAVADGAADVSGHGVADDSAKVELWVAEVQSMAERLRYLAAAAPSAIGRSLRLTAETETCVSGDDIDRWQSAAVRLEELRVQISHLRTEASVAEVEADEAERRCAAAHDKARALAGELATAEVAAAAARLEEHRTAAAAVALSAGTVAAARAAVLAAMYSSRRDAADRAEALGALRAKAAVHSKAADEAEAEAARAAALRESAKGLQAAERRKAAGEARLDQVSKDVDSLRRNVDTLNAQLEAASRSGAGARADALQVRATQLERECKEAVSSIAGGAGAGGAEKNANSAECAPPGDAELISAKECNRQLVIEVREARARREEAAAVVGNLEEEVKSLEGQRLRDVFDLRDTQEQLETRTAAVARLESEVESTQNRIAELQRMAQEVEDDAKRTRERHVEVDATTRGLMLARRRAEENACVLEFRLKYMVEKLKKERPDAPLLKALMPLTSKQMPRETRTEWLGGRRRVGRQGSFGMRGVSDADGDTESHDADVSTTAGESVTEGLLDVSSLLDNGLS